MPRFFAWGSIDAQVVLFAQRPRRPVLRVLANITLASFRLGKRCLGSQSSELRHGVVIFEARIDQHQRSELVAMMGSRTGHEFARIGNGADGHLHPRAIFPFVGIVAVERSRIAPVGKQVQI